MAWPSDVYATPIRARPRKTWGQAVNAALFILVFHLACIMLNGAQIIFLFPLRLLPLRSVRRLYNSGVRYTKGSFATLLVLTNQWFAPTHLVVTFETQGAGKFTKAQIQRLVERDATGRVVALNLPDKLVLIANHQMYADWWYLWCLMYFTRTHQDVLIVLKKSLKWIPILGWGMQFFNFIFLARSWASDREYLASMLARLGLQAQQDQTPLALIIYPEGTLVSEHTRPVSKKFADKVGIADMKHTLLPRSTGLHYSLRALSPRVPDLHLLDITVAYPGIPPLGYGQSYYTLRSIFMDRVPPPSIHLHLRLWPVASDVPIGDVSRSKPNAIPNGLGDLKRPNPVEVEVPERERVVFEEWLQERWRDKDLLIETFLETGSFSPGKEAEAVEIPMQLRSRLEIINAFISFLPTGLSSRRMRKEE